MAACFIGFLRLIFCLGEVEDQEDDRFVPLLRPEEEEKEEVRFLASARAAPLSSSSSSSCSPSPFFYPPDPAHTVIPTLQSIYPSRSAPASSATPLVERSEAPRLGKPTASPLPSVLWRDSAVKPAPINSILAESGKKPRDELLLSPETIERSPDKSPEASTKGKRLGLPHAHSVAPPPSVRSVWVESFRKKSQDKQPEAAPPLSIRSVWVESVEVTKDTHPEINSILAESGKKRRDELLVSPETIERSPDKSPEASTRGKRLGLPHAHSVAPPPSVRSVWVESFRKKSQDKQPEATPPLSIRSVRVESVEVTKDTHPEINRARSVLPWTRAVPAPLESNPPHPPKKSPGSSKNKSYAVPVPSGLDQPPGPPNNTTMLPVYQIPEHLKEMIRNDKIPEVLTTPLSPSTYASYFATLLYAEDFYLEKWSKFLLHEVTLKLREDPVFEKSRKNKKTSRRRFVAFEIDSVPERRPYLLSRDFVFLKPLGKLSEPFQGNLVCVAKSTTALAEFDDDFHSQHSSSQKYDVSFSFNRVCLKRSHHAVSAAFNPLLRNILFPITPASTIPYPDTSNQNQVSVTKRILNLKGHPPYLIEGPLSVMIGEEISETGDVIPVEMLSKTGAAIREVILQIYRTSCNRRILICAPRNKTCDALTRSLLKEIPESELFRANAAFRDIENVPDDILSSCLYEEECFTCPPLSELRSFKVIMSTFMSSFRLQCAGIGADHFTHIFLVDASSSTEPETIVALANLVGDKTAIIISGSSKDYSHLIRSDIARKYGLQRSFFQRLMKREPYLSGNPMFVAHLG